LQVLHIVRRRRDGRMNREIGFTNNRLNECDNWRYGSSPRSLPMDLRFLLPASGYTNDILSGSTNYVCHGRISSCLTLWLRRDLLQLTVTVQSVTPRYSTHHVDGAVPIVIWHVSDCVVFNSISHHRTSTQRFTAPHCIH